MLTVWALDSRLKLGPKKLLYEIVKSYAIYLLHKCIIVYLLYFLFYLWSGCYSVEFLVQLV